MSKIRRARISTSISPTRRTDPWVIVDRRTGKMVLFDYRCPVYWRRDVARDDASDHGLIWSGDDADVEIRRCAVKATR